MDDAVVCNKERLKSQKARMFIATHLIFGHNSSTNAWIAASVAGGASE